MGAPPRREIHSKRTSPHLGSDDLFALFMHLKQLIETLEKYDAAQPCPLTTTISTWINWRAPSKTAFADASGEPHAATGSRKTE